MCCGRSDMRDFALPDLGTSLNQSVRPGSPFKTRQRGMYVKNRGS